MSSPVISAKGIERSFQQGDTTITVLHGIDLEVAKGEQIAIIGASGSGKSTLLHLLGGLDSVTSGSVTISGERIDKLNEKQKGELRNRQLGFVYQFHHLLPEFTALENVAFPLLIRRTQPKQAAVLATAILQQVGLGHRLHHKPGELSGGERQRTAIARALVTKPNAILADEPTGNLDRQTAMAIHDIMLQLNREYNTALIVVTHDEKLASLMDRQLYLKDGLLQQV